VPSERFVVACLTTTGLERHYAHSGYTPVFRFLRAVLKKIFGGYLRFGPLSAIKDGCIMSTIF
jgi:hypothetical protein